MLKDEKEKGKQPQDNGNISMTALAVLDAFLRGLEETYPQYFTQNEIEVIQFMVKHALENYQKSDFKFFKKMPRFLQKTIVNKTGGEAFDEHMVTRKMVARDAIEAAMKSGIKNIIFLGSGFDPRTYLLAEQHPEVTVYDSDFGNTLKCKIAGLKKYHQLKKYFEKTIKTNVIPIQKNENNIPDNLKFVDIRIGTDDIKSKLTNEGLNITEPKIVVIEGVTSYLTLEENKILLSSLSQILNDKDQVVITYVPYLEHISDAALKEADEPYNFAILPKDLNKLINEYGFDITAKALHEDMLDEVGQHIAAKAHRNNPQSPKAHFYVLTKNSQLKPELTKDIKDVPNVKLDLTQLRDIPKPCMIM